MKLILHLVGVIVEVEHDAVVVAKRDQLAEQLGLGVKLLVGFRAWGMTDRGPQGLAAELLEPGNEQLSIAENLGMPGAVPHGPFEGHPDHRELMLLLECQDPLDGVCRTKRGVHQLEAVDSGVGHVREDLVKDRVNVVPGLRCGVDPGVGADDHALFGTSRGPGTRFHQAGSDRQGRRPQEPAPGQEDRPGCTAPRSETSGRTVFSGSTRMEKSFRRRVTPPFLHHRDDGSQECASVSFS